MFSEVVLLKLIERLTRALLVYADDSERGAAAKHAVLDCHSVLFGEIAPPPQPVGVVAPVLDRSPAMTPMALQASSEPHEHSWFQACRQDRFGLMVMDCACGARKRVRQGPFGSEEVPVPPPDNVLGDVLFDMSNIPAPPVALQQGA